MPLYLIKPGSRKGNTYWLVRGTLGGRRYEVSTKTRDKEAALKFKAGLELEILGGRPPVPGEDVTFARGTDLYIAWRSPSKADLGRLERLKTAIGTLVVDKIRQADLVDAANRLCPDKSPATKNREALRPAAAVLHYCAKQGWCPWLRIELFKEKKPATRAVSHDVARALIAAIPDLPEFKQRHRPEYLERAAARQRKKRLLLLWLFRQGTRISDTLRTETEHLDMVRRTVRFRVGKTDRWLELPLHDDLWELLANDPPAKGYLFPWRQKTGVYRWLRPLARQLGIRFTPHMARHSLGKWLNEQGAGTRQIMDALGHADVKSSMRYQSTDVEVIRQAGRRLGKLVG